MMSDLVQSDSKSTRVARVLGILAMIAVLLFALTLALTSLFASARINPVDYSLLKIQLLRENPLVNVLIAGVGVGLLVLLAAGCGCKGRSTTTGPGPGTGSGSGTGSVPGGDPARCATIAGHVEELYRASAERTKLTDGEIADNVAMVLGETIGMLLTDPRLRARHAHERALQQQLVTKDLKLP